MISYGVLTKTKITKIAGFIVDLQHVIVLKRKNNSTFIKWFIYDREVIAIADISTFWFDPIKEKSIVSPKFFFNEPAW